MDSRAADDHSVPHIFLQPGGLYCSARPAVVTTVLGSCVSICLWAPSRHCCAINHFILPFMGDNPPSLRYGDVSTKELLEAMRRQGCADEDIQAKVFGGAAVLPTGSPDFNVGVQNIKFAFEYLRSAGIWIAASCTGGQSGMLIRLVTDTGEVFVRPVRALAK